MGLVALSAAALACNQEDAQPPAEADESAAHPEHVEAETSSEVPELTTYGELRRINIEGDMSASIGLTDALSGSSRLNHAVGALGELSGEITVWDDKVYLADAGEPPVFSVLSPNEVDEAKDATLLFGAAVSDWEPVPIEGGGDLDALERALDAWRSQKRVDEALAFRITDPAATADWHVIDAKRLPDGVSSCDERMEYAHAFESRNEPLRIVGLHTDNHTGVVVDHSTSLHAHVITDDDRTGHLDDLTLSTSARLEVAVRDPM